MKQLAPAGVTVGRETIRLGDEAEKLLRWCDKCGEDGLQCAHVQVPEPLLVILDRERRVRRVRLWEQGGAAEFNCRLFVSIERDLNELIGPPSASAACKCGEGECGTSTLTSAWSLKDGGYLVLTNFVHMERTMAPDGTPISTLDLSLSDKPPVR